MLLYLFYRPRPIAKHISDDTTNSGANTKSVWERLKGTLKNEETAAEEPPVSDIAPKERKRRKKRKEKEEAAQAADV